MTPSLHPADAFASEEPSYRSIAAQVEAMKIRALNPKQYEDVLTMLEYMQAQCVAQHQLNVNASEQLTKRENALAERERDCALRARVINAVIVPRRSRWLLWR